MNRMIPALLALSLLPLLAHAQAYKCRQTDGSLGFQDHPCPGGSIETPLSLAPVQGYTAVPLGHTPDADSSVRMTGGTPRAEQLERLNADNDNLQVEAVRIRTEHRHWEKDDRLKRLEAHSEALNAQVRAENKRAHAEAHAPVTHAPVHMAAAHH